MKSVACCFLPPKWMSEHTELACIGMVLNSTVTNQKGHFLVSVLPQWKNTGPDLVSMVTWLQRVVGQSIYELKGPGPTVPSGHELWKNHHRNSPAGLSHLFTVVKKPAISSGASQSWLWNLTACNCVKWFPSPCLPVYQRESFACMSLLYFCANSEAMVTN